MEASQQRAPGGLIKPSSHRTFAARQSVGEHAQNPTHATNFLNSAGPNENRAYLDGGSEYFRRRVRAETRRKSSSYGGLMLFEEV